MIRRRLLLHFGIIFIAGVFGACTTLGTGGNAVPASVQRTVELFGSGTIGEVVSICQAPILFDSEVIIRESDIRSIIGALRNAGIEFEAESISSLDGAQRYPSVFGSNYELDTFRTKYVPEEAALVVISSGSIEVTMLLGDRVGDYQTILGLAVTE